MNKRTKCLSSNRTSLFRLHSVTVVIRKIIGAGGYGKVNSARDMQDRRVEVAAQCIRTAEQDSRAAKLQAAKVARCVAAMVLSD